MSGDILERGLYDFQNGNFKQACALFTKVINDTESIEDQFEALKRRSACYLEIGDYGNALKDANVLIDVCPNVTSGYALCGNALTKLQKFEDALAVFRKGLEIDKDDPEIKTGLKDMQVEIKATFEKGGTEKTYNAIKMSSQAAYPGDNELEVLEKEIMEKWGILKFPDIEIVAQNPVKALKFYEDALQNRKAGNDNNAIELLRTALTYDAANFTLRGELATLLYETHVYKEAFQQCNSVPPDFRQAKYWMIGAKSLDGLELPVHAESWLRQGCRLDRNDTEMALLFQNIRVKRLYGPLTDGTKARVIFTQYGRAVEAAVKMDAGENCFRDKPAVLSQTLDTLEVPACAHCAKNLMKPEDYFEKGILATNADLRRLVQRYWPIRQRVYCTKCGDKMMYCSVDCREESWAAYHQVLCPSVNPAVDEMLRICAEYKNLSSSDSRCWRGYWNASFSPFVMARIWASIICLANNIARQGDRDTPNAADWAMAKSPYRKFIAYGSGSNAAMIPKMYELMQTVFDNEDLPANFRYKINQNEFDARYFQCTCNVQAFSDPAPPFNVFMNSIGRDPKREMVRQYTMADPDEAMFAGMFPLHACLNHSCDNNVEVLDGHPGVLVRAKKPLKQGDELFTTYINTRMPRKERRAWLYRGYNFWCQCSRCKFEGDDPDKCTQCGKEAKDDNKDKYPACGKCHRAWYCSTACQKVAWKKGHKQICMTNAVNDDVARL